MSRPVPSRAASFCRPNKVRRGRMDPATSEGNPRIIGAEVTAKFQAMTISPPRARLPHGRKCRYFAMQVAAKMAAFGWSLGAQGERSDQNVDLVSCKKLQASITDYSW